MNNIYSINKYTTATASITYGTQKPYKNVFFRKNTKPVLDTVKAQYILQNILI